MTTQDAIDIATQALIVTAKVAAPFLLVVLALGLIVGLFQSVTQLQEPTLSDMNDVALQPLMNEEVSFTEAADAATVPLRDFMLRSTREAAFEMFLDASGTVPPVVRAEVPLTALIPAFVLPQLTSA